MKMVSLKSLVGLTTQILEAVIYGLVRKLYLYTTNTDTIKKKDFL